MDHLLTPGAGRAEGLLDDAALLRALLRVEVAWAAVLAGQGAVRPEDADAVARAAAGPLPAPDPRDVEAAGNPVLPLVRALRERVGQAGAAVHTGLTSQDVLDTALMLLARDALAAVSGSLARASAHLAALADTHRDAVMAGRTLTQHAVPVTFGLTAAQWLVGVLDADGQARAVRAALPVQCGGAAGTLSLAGVTVADPLAAARDLAARLGLTWPGLPWHTRRTPVTRVGDAAVQVCDAVGAVAGDVLVLGRPEIAEVREAPVAGRGGSSTMPHKQNPVLAVLVHAAALQAPSLGAQLHLAAAQSVDQRAPGAWHAEWPALRRLLELAVVAASQAAELVGSLEVDTGAMRRRADAVAADLLAERGDLGGDGPGDPVDDPGGYLGSTSAFVDAALARHRTHSSAHSSAAAVPEETP